MCSRPSNEREAPATGQTAAAAADKGAGGPPQGGFATDHRVWGGERNDAGRRAVPTRSALTTSGPLAGRFSQLRARDRTGVVRLRLLSVLAVPELKFPELPGPTAAYDDGVSTYRERREVDEI